ncbi:hypothetical protein B9Z55_026872 [Caenorhabditis nigoni]|uniref:Mos1 transposase HTH domain-containing protein n=1 Tax=Caenorhabditis nigoni TaxID=1611254 RepID=A0A2G5SIB8_9PELO|nr:hypothetical protein B9Z55_026872 [Caenorhabditis nigoni]
MDSKLVDTPEKDPKTLILEEFQLGKPIFESYKNFCKKMGPEFLDYPEFEFWWMRFTAGNFDLDYDRSQDPKPKTIEDIPANILEKICGNLEDDHKNIYWLTLRLVCKSVRGFVDAWTPPKFTSIAIYHSEGKIIFSFDGFKVSYTEKSENLSEIGFFHDPKCLQRGNFRDLAIDDLTKILAVPGDYKLQRLVITGEIDDVFTQKLSEKFENLSINIHVDSVFLNLLRIETDRVNNILNLFPPIKEISIKSDDFPSEELAKEIKGISSLKNVEMVRIHNTYAHSNIFGFREEGFWNPFDLDIPRITLTFDKSKVDIFLLLIKSLRNSPHLEYCHIIGHIKPCQTLYSGLERLGAEIDPENWDIYYYPIPDSDDFFEIRFVRNPDRRFNNLNFFHDIFIERKSSLA